MSLRVALFVSSLRGGGAERAMLDIARGLSQRGLAVDLVLVEATGAYMENVPPDVRLIDLDSRKVVSCFPRLARYLRRERPDVIISTMTRVNVMAILARNVISKGTAVVARRAAAFSMEYTHGNLKERILLRLERFLLQYAEAVVTNSREAASDLHSADSNVGSIARVIYNPVVWPDIHEQASASACHPWLSDKSTPVILAAGRIVPHKDYRTLLIAFAKVVIKSLSARLIILGEGPELPALRSLARNLGVTQYVDFPGFMVNPFAFMSKAAVFAHSSVYEGLPNVIVQAMACGTPVVSTDCLSGPRELLQNGELGRLVPVGDWRALGEAILKTLENPTEPDRLIQGTSEFLAEHSIDQYVQLVCELASSSSRRQR